MDRRQFAIAALSTCATGLLSRPAVAAPQAARRHFAVTTRVTLPDSENATEAFLPLFARQTAYQVAARPRWNTTGMARVVEDHNNGARALHVTWQRGAEQSIELVEHLATWERGNIPRGHLSTTDRRRYTASSPTLPTGGLIRERANAIAGHLGDPRARARAIYDWVVDNTWRDPATPGCGTGDVVAMLRDDRMGGKCADINALMIALSRAVGLPARDIYGIRLADSALFPSLGRSGAITGAQHCRAEVWLDNAGWLAVDPADVRKAVLEEKLPLDSEPIRALRERLFGRWEANWAGYNDATSVELPGAPAAPQFHFLMYPIVAVNGQALSCLDAKASGYSIACSEVS
jgi:transglutaminase-like putative cysteine protease